MQFYVSFNKKTKLLNIVVRIRWVHSIQQHTPFPLHGLHFIRVEHLCVYHMYSWAQQTPSIQPILVYSPEYAQTFSIYIWNVRRKLHISLFLTCSVCFGTWKIEHFHVYFREQFWVVVHRRIRSNYVEKCNSNSHWNIHVVYNGCVWWTCNIVWVIQSKKWIRNGPQLAGESNMSVYVDGMVIMNRKLILIHM